MKIYLRDIIWLMLLISLGLAWWNDGARLRKTANDLRLEADAAEQRQMRRDTQLETANMEADVLLGEVRRLRGLLKSSLADQRQWFELEVERNELIAIRLATSESNVVTMDTIERIESETGLAAKRLRHFLTPIPELQLGHV